VILTGFGLFAGANFNISGAVISSMASGSLDDGSLNAGDKGARIVNRAMQIGTQYVEVCLIVADVLWDFAGAIFIQEMQRFKPDLVIMTGRGGATAVVEAGALNEASKLSGFNPDGSADPINSPVSAKILPDDPDAEAAMTWNQRAVANKIQPMIEQLGFNLEIPASARIGNDYICNNVSFIAAKAASGVPIPLAGGELTLSVHAPYAPKVGFFHYPIGAKLTASEIVAWQQILLSMVEVALTESQRPLVR
jgi:hypothetical protein